MKAPRLEAVIPSLNGHATIADCIQSLLDQTVDDLIVHVVDDGSEPSLRADVDAFLGSGRVRYHRQEQGGANRARNHGIRVSEAPLLAFVDDDQVLPSDWAERALRTFDERPDIDALGGPYREFPGAVRTCSKCDLAAKSVPGSHPQRATQRLLGGNMIIRRSEFDRAGGFDESMLGLGDETEWFMRADRGRYVFDDDLWVWHRRDHMTRRQIVRKAYRYGRASTATQARLDLPYPTLARQAVHGLLHHARRGCWNGSADAAYKLGTLVAKVSARQRPAAAGGRIT